MRKERELNKAFKDEVWTKASNGESVVIEDTDDHHVYVWRDDSDNPLAINADTFYRDFMRNRMQEPLQHWFRRTYLNKDSEFYVSEDKIYRNSGSAQVLFVRDDLARLFVRGVDRGTEPGSTVAHKWHEMVAFVIGEHYSKSCALPVYMLEMPGKPGGNGLRVYLRGNFHDWKVSVRSTRPISIDPTGLFRATPAVAPDYSSDDLNPVYFEGFPKDLVFGPYCEDNCRFSAMLGNENSLYTFLFLLVRSFEGDQWRQAERDHDAETLRRAEEHRKAKAVREVERLERELAAAKQQAGM